MQRVDGDGAPVAAATTVSVAGGGKDRSRLGLIGIQLAMLEGAIFAVAGGMVWYLHVVRPQDRALLEVWLAGTLGLFSLSALLIAASATRRTHPPASNGEPLPPVTALIPAYLPNEAPILLETIQAHLRNGPDDMQILVVYNTPEPMAIEQELAELAARDPG